MRLGVICVWTTGGRSSALGSCPPYRPVLPTLWPERIKLHLLIKMGDPFPVTLSIKIATECSANWRHFRRYVRTSYLFWTRCRMPVLTCPRSLERPQRVFPHLLLRLGRLRLSSFQRYRRLVADVAQVRSPSSEPTNSAFPCLIVSVLMPVRPPALCVCPTPGQRLGVNSAAVFARPAVRHIALSRRAGWRRGARVEQLLQAGILGEVVAKSRYALQCQMLCIPEHRLGVTGADPQRASAIRAEKAQGVDEGRAMGPSQRPGRLCHGIEVPADHGAVRLGDGIRYGRAIDIPTSCAQRPEIGPIRPSAGRKPPSLPGSTQPCPILREGNDRRGARRGC